MITAIGILSVLTFIGLCILAALIWAQRNIVSAREFLLEDKYGKIYAKLGVSEQRPGLVFFDRANKQRAIFTVTDKGPSLALLSEDGEKVQGGFSVDEEGTHLKLCNKNGETKIAIEAPEIAMGPDMCALYLYDKEGNKRAAFSETETGAVIWLLDEEGKILWQKP